MPRNCGIKGKITLINSDGEEIDITRDAKEIDYNQEIGIGGFFSVSVSEEAIRGMIEITAEIAKPTRQLMGPVMAEIYGVLFCAN